LLEVPLARSREVAQARRYAADGVPWLDRGRWLALMLRKLLMIFVGVAAIVVAIEVASGTGVGRALTVALYGAIGASIGYAALLSYQRKQGH